MEKIILFGAGQIGAAVARLMGPGFEVLCFADNNERRWGTVCENIPVRSPAEALSLLPDRVCLCAAGGERQGQMAAQLHSLGYVGPVLTPEALKIFDIRAGTMRLLARQINALGVAGDVAELGVFRGDFAGLINGAFPHRPIHLFDTFSGFPAEDAALDADRGYSRAEAGDFSDTAMSLVAQALPHPEMARFHKGYFPETFSPCRDIRFAFVSIDADLYAPTAAALPIFWDRLSPGGALMIHDAISAQYTGVARAVEEFCRPRGLLPVPVCDLHGSMILRKEL